MTWREFGPKRPPPTDGIKVRKLGVTWWGRRWLDALEHFSRDYLNRLGRGRTYARTGRVHHLKVSPGKVTARVTGSGSTPYQVSLSMDAFSDAAWEAAIALMAQEARFAAELLSGQMPQDIDAVFAKHNRSLFPRKSHDLATDCSCPDWANPCKHVAAMHYVLGEAFDRDPFLLFELRGRTREQVLEALGRLRSETMVDAAGAGAPAGAATSVEIAPDTAADYERIPTPLPAMQFNFDPPPSPAAILRAVPPPRGWTLEETPAEFFADAYEGTAGLARALALEPGTEIELQSNGATSASAGKRREKKAESESPRGRGGTRGRKKN